MSGHFSGRLNTAARGWLQTFLGSAERSQCWLSVRLFCGGQHSRRDVGLLPRLHETATLAMVMVSAGLSLRLLCRGSSRLNTAERGWLQPLLGSAKRSPRDVGLLPRRHKTATLSMVMVLLGFL